MTREEAKQAAIQSILGRNEEEINAIMSQIETATTNGKFQVDIVSDPSSNPSVIPSQEVQLYFTQSLGYTIQPILKLEKDRGGDNITYQGIRFIWGNEPGRPFENYMDNASKNMFTSGI